MNEAYLQLYDYHIWANERVWNHLQSLPEDLFLQEVNLGFKSIAEVFGHLAVPRRKFGLPGSRKKVLRRLPRDRSRIWKRPINT